MLTFAYTCVEDLFDVEGDAYLCYDSAMIEMDSCCEPCNSDVTGFPVSYENGTL